MYCRAHHLLPEPINLTIVPNEQIYQYDTRSKHSVHIEARRTNLYAKSFIHAGPEYWNKLPQQVKTAPLILSFSRRLTQHLIEKYQSNTEA